MPNSEQFSGNKCTIAIDGPAGSGKSTVARKLADRLGYTYIDTGAMYRAVAYRALQAGLDVESDATEIAALAGCLHYEFRNVGNEQHLFTDAEDVEEAIRRPEVGNLSSAVSAIPEMREHLVAVQRQMAAQGGVVMEGRDIGTVVLPQAEVKIFLTASVQERARRRQQQLREKGIQRDLDEILREQQQRDERDRTRSVAPLRVAPDARQVVTDNMTEDEVVDLLERIVRQAEQYME